MRLSRFLLALALVACSFTIVSGQVAYLTPLTPQQENPPTTATAVGIAVTVVTGSTLSCTVYHNETQPNNAHIHNGAVGVNGPVIFGLPTFLSPISATTTLSAANLTNLQNGNLYFNVHSVPFPGGAIRGQIQNPGPSRVFVSEVCPNPTGLDVNLDGTPAGANSQIADEFVELVNATNGTVNLAGWTLSDGSGIRHVFSAGTTLGPGQCIVVFGGSVAGFTPGFAAVRASSGNLGLNDSSDTVVLSDAGGFMIDLLSYSSAPVGTSLARSPMTATAPLVAHSTLGSATGAHRSTTIAVPFIAGTVGAAALPAEYPGNGADCALQVAKNFVADPVSTNVHTMTGGDFMTVDLVSPGGRLNGESFILAVQFFPTGMPPAALTLPGDASASVPLDITMPITIVIDSIGTTGAFLNPVLGPYTLNAVIPPILSGSGLSFMMVLLASAPGHNFVNLGVADSHEIEVP